MRQDIEFDAEGVTLRAGCTCPTGRRTGPTVVMAHALSAVKEMYLDDFAEAFAAGGLGALARLRDTALRGLAQDLAAVDLEADAVEGAGPPDSVVRPPGLGAGAQHRSRSSVQYLALDDTSSRPLTSLFAEEFAGAFERSGDVIARQARLLLA